MHSRRDSEDTINNYQYHDDKEAEIIMTMNNSDDDNGIMLMNNGLRHRSSDLDNNNHNIDGQSSPITSSSSSSSSSSDNTATIESIHYSSTIAICICTFTHSWLLVSVFPYSGFMIIQLIHGTNEENTGFYAGILSAAFMIGRAITSYHWGKISDTYGRRIVLFISLMLSSFFSILFGLSTTFAMAFLWRFLLGASNGVAGISKAIVSETARDNELLETRGMSMSMGMWGWGFLLSPGISGFLSDPIRQYPQLQNILSNHDFIYVLLKRYPFFLPNLVSVFLCLIALIAVEIWVPETLQNRRNPRYMLHDLCYYLFKRTKLVHNDTTLEEEQRRLLYGEIDYDDDEVSEYPTGRAESNNVVKNARLVHTESVSLLSTSSPHLPPVNHNDAMNLRADINVGNDTSQGDIQNPEEAATAAAAAAATMSSIWSKQDTRDHLILYWIFSFVAIAIDEAFPLFCISKEGGLGLSEKEIGKLLSATGLIFALTQYHVYAWIVDKYGLSKSIEIGAYLSIPLVLFVPISILLNRNPTGAMHGGSGTSNSLSWPSFIYLAILLAACRVFGLVFFSSITIATNRTVIPSHRGTMNGMSMLGGSFAKALGPMFAGWLTAVAISSGMFPPKVGASLVFAAISMFGMISAVMTSVVLGRKDEQINDDVDTAIVE
jgi:MFS family permease